MSKLMSLAAIAGLLIAQTEASAAFGTSGMGGIAVWQTPENEPGAQARRGIAEQTRQAYGQMRHHHSYRHHDM